MNDIRRIDGYRQLPAIGQQPANGIAKNQMVHSAGKSEDQVQISEMAVYLSRIATMPEIRTEKVAVIKQALASGTYDIEGKLSIALDNFLEEYVV